MPVGAWPEPESGDYGLVWIQPLERFGYYDDNEDDETFIVYLGVPMLGEC